MLVPAPADLREPRPTPASTPFISRRNTGARSRPRVLRRPPPNSDLRVGAPRAYACQPECQTVTA